MEFLLSGNTLLEKSSLEFAGSTCIKVVLVGPVGAVELRGAPVASYNLGNLTPLQRGRRAKDRPSGLFLDPAFTISRSFGRRDHSTAWEGSV